MGTRELLSWGSSDAERRTGAPSSLSLAAWPVGDRRCRCPDPHSRGALHPPDAGTGDSESRAGRATASSPRARLGSTQARNQLASTPPSCWDRSCPNPRPPRPEPAPTRKVVGGRREGRAVPRGQMDAVSPQASDVQNHCYPVAFSKGSEVISLEESRASPFFGMCKPPCMELSHQGRGCWPVQASWRGVSLAPAIYTWVTLAKYPNLAESPLFSSGSNGHSCEELMKKQNHRSATNGSTPLPHPIQWLSVGRLPVAQGLGTTTPKGT
nr:uncharacterized protein LOC109729793 [Microcebus murinus]